MQIFVSPGGRRYNPELTAQWTREISDEIKNRLKNDLELPRYKFVVQVVVGEQRGEGVRMGVRCFWDADTDNYAEESFRNVRADALHRALLLNFFSLTRLFTLHLFFCSQDSLFCVATVFGSYTY